MRACGNSNNEPIAPLELQSPVGQLLSQILHTHPHLLPAAVDHQLQNLLTEKQASQPVQQDLLYKYSSISLFISLLESSTIF